MSDPDKTDTDDGLELEPDLVKDLDVDEEVSGVVRGGQSFGGSAPTHQA